MEEQKFEKINEQDVEQINDGAAQTVNEKAAEEVQAEKAKRNKKIKIVGAVIGGVVVVGITAVGVAHYIRKGQLGKAVNTIDAAKEAIPELAQSAIAEAPAQLVETAAEV